MGIHLLPSSTGTGRHLYVLLLHRFIQQQESHLRAFRLSMGAHAESANLSGTSHITYITYITQFKRKLLANDSSANPSNQFTSGEQLSDGSFSGFPNDCRQVQQHH